ncbi:MAG: DegV family protein [Clostridiales bacterium]|nr:DegV family protein [Clostridiales bacterium]
MNDYVIFADSGCDILPDKLGEWEVKTVDLLFRKEGEDREYTQAEMPTKDFYEKMRGGTVFRTSAANEASIRAAFEPVLREGRDVLYVCFGSGLSGTAGTAKLTAEALEREFPGRKVIVIDTLCASAGHGLILRFAVQAKRNGASIEEAAAVVLEKRPNLCHWFTVDDLVYLKRGGRVSAAAAFFGGVLNIKPVLHVDDDGHLIPVIKVRGRINSIKAIAKKYTETALDPENGTYFISHGDCLEDALKLERMLFEAHGKKADLITDIGPVIGAHSGPGTLALFFLGKQR